MANHPDGEVLATAIEHSSVLRNAARWAGAGLRLLPVDGNGRLDPGVLAAALTPRTRLVCVQFANNELGTRQDVPALLAAVRANGGQALVLLDACQGAGKVAAGADGLDLRQLGVDFASLAGHKFGAPKGIGLLYVRNGLRVAPLIAGGRQQQDRRSGSEDTAGACALASALTVSLAHAGEEDLRQRTLLDACWQRLSSALPGARWLARAAPRLPGTMSLAHAGVGNEHLVARLDLAGFAISTGAACMAARGEPSHVVAALGIAPDLARSVVRVSIGPATTTEQLLAFADAYVHEVRSLIALTPSSVVTR